MKKALGWFVIFWFFFPTFTDWKQTCRQGEFTHEFEKVNAHLKELDQKLEPEGEVCLPQEPGPWDEPVALIAQRLEVLKEAWRVVARTCPGRADLPTGLDPWLEETELEP